MADGIIIQDEEARLREFRDQLALGSDTADSGAMAHLDRASQDQLILEAKPSGTLRYSRRAEVETRRAQR